MVHLQSLMMSVASAVLDLFAGTVGEKGSFNLK